MNPGTPPPQTRAGLGPQVSPSQGAEVTLNLPSLACGRSPVSMAILCQTTPRPIPNVGKSTFPSHCVFMVGTVSDWLVLFLFFPSFIE